MKKSGTNIIIDIILLSIITLIILILSIKQGDWAPIIGYEIALLIVLGLKLLYSWYLKKHPVTDPFKENDDIKQ